MIIFKALNWDCGVAQRVRIGARERNKLLNFHLKQQVERPENRVVLQIRKSAKLAKASGTFRRHGPNAAFQRG